MQLGPNVYVGAGVTIYPGARVKEAIILDRAEIQVYTERLLHLSQLCDQYHYLGSQLCLT